jgi:rubrerythrin
MINKKQVIEFLSSLDELELIDLLYDVFQSKREEEKWGEKWHIETYVIGHSTSTSIDPVAYTEILARPRPETVEEGVRGFLVSGQCPLCKTIISSNEKIAICPICSGNVECT